jgi:uncharacterized membrane protein YebE (DUF533 family)
MFDAKRLLDQFLGPQGNQGFGQPQGNLQGSQFGDIARNLGGSLSGNLGGIGGGALAGGLAGILLGTKQGRKIAGTAATVGGMALVGALAYGAYKNWQAGRAPGASADPQRASVPLLPPPRDTPFNPVSESEQQSLANGLMRAMIAAAKSDGHIDAAEQANIFAQMDKLNLSAEEKAFVLDELRKPLDIDAVAQAARTPEQAAEIYVASLLAIDVDNPAERGYLAMLAARLRLDEKLVEHLHATVEDATQPQPAAVSAAG